MNKNNRRKGEIKIPKFFVQWLVNGEAFYVFGGMSRREFKLMVLKTIATEAYGGNATNQLGVWIRKYPETALRYVLDRPPFG
ncbi:hypothetical protein [Levilactobacillus brevis]|uniref:hypothetical protein n=1 Tax=Levilactobacillus brevis TaxID=1580 RepID=UPI000D3ACDCD|nr:hypothetical protein [Levilactobacillus brevis]PUD96036.1 hypothetical protein DA477_09465 [Levilactobacillus brevis]WAE45967.1 hypothetical protein OUY26_05140 [Levilactobacillus brevis]